MGGIVFIDATPLSSGRSIQSYELEQARARSVASRVGHAKKKQAQFGELYRCRKAKPSRSPKSDCSIASHEQDELALKGMCLSGQRKDRVLHSPPGYVVPASWKHSPASQRMIAMPISNPQLARPEQRIAFQHWLAVTAPWQSEFHGSSHAKFWKFVVPQLAQEFVPIRDLLVALELIDLPAFFGETLSDRRERTMGYYNNAVRMLRKDPWPRVCVIVASLLAYLLELRWTQTANAEMHLRSCQQLLTDYVAYDSGIKYSLAFIEDIKDTLIYGNHFIRLHTRWRMLKKLSGYQTLTHGIEKMPEISHDGESLEQYLTQFTAFTDDLSTRMLSDLNSFNTLQALHMFDDWDDFVHQLCQAAIISNSVTALSFTLFYVGLFLIPFKKNGLLGVYYDSSVLDRVLDLFEDKMARVQDAAEWNDVQMVVNLGAKTILRFPHAPRHATKATFILHMLKLKSMIFDGVETSNESPHAITSDDYGNCR